MWPGPSTIAPGEQHKTLAEAERVWQALLAAGMTRADHVVALGGGVVGDLAGFCAATYQRGVPVVQVPTTLVAQVDSAYGGKTGVDLPEAKNYVGVYHQPAGVLVDPDALETLPAAELAAGWVEVLKTALIAGGALWEHVGGGGATDTATIVRVRPHEARGGRRATSATAGGARCSTSGTRSATRSRRRPATGATATARPSAWACWRRCGSPDSDELRARVRELLAERGLPVALDGVAAEDVLERDRARQEAGRADVCRSCS